MTDQQQKVKSTVSEHGGRIGSVRWGICALLFFATMVNYLDRGILGNLKNTLMKSLHWNDADFGRIVAAFMFTYAFGYLLGGRFMGVMGVRKGLSWASGVWSLAACSHALVHTVTGFQVVRSVLGISEGGNFPAAIRTVSEWFPVKERALATGIFNSASNIGAIIGPLVLPTMAIKLGWRAAFIITGMLGFIWIVFWLIYYRKPSEHPNLSKAELEYIQSDSEENALGVEAVPSSWLELALAGPTWAYISASALTGFVWWFILFWVQGFLKETFNISEVLAGRYLAIIYTISVIGSIGGGWLSKVLLGMGLDLNKTRKYSLLACALCALPFSLVGLPKISLFLAVGCISLCAAAHQAWSSNLYTFVSDIFPKRDVSTVVGIGGFASSLCAAFFALVVGDYLKNNHGVYYLPYLFSGFAYLISVAMLHFIVPNIEKAAKQRAALDA
jgi:ACS family hexuronate transporter-like MFS transporter